MPSVTAANEQDLVERLKRKSPDAFEELVHQHASRLYSASFRIVRNTEDAEDSVQETFLKAFRAIDQFRGDSSLFTWLHTIVCNESLMKVRLRTRRVILPIEPFLPEFDDGGRHAFDIPDWSQHPELSLRAAELSEFLETCIDALPEEYRLAYILKDVEKLSEDKVCEILRVSKSTMKNRVHRARLVIRQRIEDEFVAPKAGGSTGLNRTRSTSRSAAASYSIDY